VCWLGVVLALWTLAHALNRWWMLDQSSPSLRFAWLTSAKLVAWLAPTIWLLQPGAASVRNMVRFVGLDSTRGLGVALCSSVAWLALQQAGVGLGLPLFTLPAPALDPHSLAGALVVAPWLEEWLFRGWMLRTLRARGLQREWAVLASASAFALLHVPGWAFRRGLDLGILGPFCAMVGFGLAAGYLAWCTQSLWAPIMLHFANNLWSTGALAWLCSTLGVR
jgi:membrane protease YdiL (CAAX protease family)